MTAIRYLNRLGMITGLLLLIITSSMAAIRVEVNGNLLSFNVPPKQVNDRIMVPLRGIFESFGALVNWDPTTRMISATSGDTDVHLSIGDRNATVNGKTVQLDTPAMIINGTTMVPLRFISEALGANVNWSESKQTVSISVNQTPASHK